jgi:radical SAM superfamily enzyme YgiQ (UPF0313 family)
MKKGCKLLLVLPADAIHRAGSGIFKKSLRYAPLTLTYLASLIPENLNITLKLVDEEVDTLAGLDFKPDLVCISVMTATAPRAYAIAGYFRRKGACVVLGGVHATLLPDEALEHADSVVIGFAEDIFPKLIMDFMRNTVKRKYEASGDLPVDRIPIPRREFLKRGSYITRNTIMATRGCTGDCSFCAVPNVWRFRYFKRPVQQVMDEVRGLKGSEVVFIDVHLLGDKQYSLELLRALKQTKKKWFGLTTAQALFDQQIFDLVASSGCKGLLIGFESILQRSLKQIHKDSGLVDKYADLMKKLHNNGIRVNGTFLFGTDHEDKSVFEKTVDFANRIKIDLPRYSLFTPYPGTPVFNEYERQGRIIEYDWALYDVEHAVFRPKHMEPGELEEGLHWAWRESYGLNSIFKRLNGTRSLYWIAFLINLGYKYYAWKLPGFNKETMTDINLELE